MLAPEVLALGVAVVGLLTTIIGSSACCCKLYMANKESSSMLEEKRSELECLFRRYIQKQKDDSVLRSKNGPFKASDWIKKASDLVDNVKKLQEQKNYMDWWLSNFCCWCGAWSTVERLIPQLDQMLKEGREIMVVGVQRSHAGEKHIMDPDRTKIRKMIWHQLEQEKDSQIVCIHGLAGVGKTAMATAIHDEALKKLEYLEKVIWVSNEYGLESGNIKSQIEKQLMGSTNVLLILDSIPMWNDFDFNDIGIVLKPGSSCNWKVIVTSRTSSACKRIQEKFRGSCSCQIYEIKPLASTEDWKLFEHYAGNNVSFVRGNLRKETEIAVKALDGIPFAIKILAESLKGIPGTEPRTIAVDWERALPKELSKSASLVDDKNEDLFAPSQYGHVSPSCFFFCTLFPKGHPINAKELVEYWVWEGLLGDIPSLEKTLFDGWRELGKLEDAHLVEIDRNEEGEEQTVRMLNLVHLVSLNAAERLKEPHFSEGGKSLSHHPLAKAWVPGVKRASFVQNKLKALLNSPDCDSLSTLLLQDNPLDSNDKHLKKFFSRLINLKVLNISRTKISFLPKSVSGLQNLQALLLRDCPNLKSLPSLSMLLKLIVIDLCGTPLIQLPKGLDKLTNLRRLDLSETKVEVFRSKEVENLTQIEELMLIGSDEADLWWGSSTVHPVWTGHCIEMLSNLTSLALVQLKFMDTAVFRQFLDNVAFRTSEAVVEERIQSVARHYRFCLSHTDAVNTSTVIRDHGIMLPIGTAELQLTQCREQIRSLNFTGCLDRLKVLDIADFNALEYLLTVDMIGNLVSLKKISVKRCERIVSILQPDAQDIAAASITIPELKTLVLYDLPMLQRLSHTEELNCPLLRRIEVRKCNLLVFPATLNGGIDKFTIRGEQEWLDNVVQNSRISPEPKIEYEESPEQIPTITLSRTLTTTQGSQEPTGSSSAPGFVTGWMSRLFELIIPASTWYYL